MSSRVDIFKMPRLGGVRQFHERVSGRMRGMAKRGRAASQQLMMKTHKGEPLKVRPAEKPPNSNNIEVRKGQD